MPSLFRFDASAVVHTCSSSHRTPAPLTARRQPQRSPPRLLTDAACGGLESPPARRPRRTYLHHWHSTDRADDLLHHHHFPSGHTVSGGREPPPPALLEPYVTVSRHTAPTVRRSSASVDLLPRRVDLQTTVNCPAPSLRPHYRALTATTGRSAPVPRIGTLALAVFAACGSPSRGQQRRPSLSGRQVLLFHASACDELTPPIHRAPPGPHTGSSPTEGPPRRAFVPGPPTDPSFDAIVVSFRCVSSGSHMFVFSSHTRPANSETSTAALTTPALDRRSLRWFGISACTATPEDLPPSLAQHGSCRRSSTSSSSLPFRTHVGAGNSAVVVDLPRCGRC